LEIVFHKRDNLNKCINTDDEKTLDFVEEEEANGKLVGVRKDQSQKTI